MNMAIRVATPWYENLLPKGSRQQGFYSRWRIHPVVPRLIRRSRHPISVASRRGFTTSAWICRSQTPSSSKAYPAETTEAFLDGHVAAFAWLGGIPKSILYDNTKIAVAKIMGDGTHQTHQGIQRIAEPLPV